MAGSWSTKLHTTLRPAWDSPHDDVRNPKTRRHAPGATWKKLLGKSVFLDLAGESFKRRRRFVRLEALGLSGVIFYEISAGCTQDGPNNLEEVQDEIRSFTHLTRKTVFGDPHTPSDLGIGIDKLINVVGAKVLYFPAYACTSFASGQAMNAFLHGQSSLLPLPASEGFSVNAETLPPSSVWPAEDPQYTPRLPILRGHPLTTPAPPQRTPSLALDKMRSGLADSDSEDESDMSILTVSSDGPCTPPRIFSESKSAHVIDSFTFGFDEKTELGYVLCDAINFFDPLPIQAKKTDFYGIPKANEKENNVPEIRV